MNNSLIFFKIVPLEFSSLFPFDMPWISIVVFFLMSSTSSNFSLELIISLENKSLIE